MATEVVCLEGGRLYVGGDTFPVIFAYCNDPPTQRVRWLGSHNDMRYVAEKAQIGFGDGSLVREFRPDAAESDLDALVEEFIDCRGDDGDITPDDHPMLVAFREARERICDGEEEIYGFLREAAEECGCGSFMEERYSIGMVVSTRVYCAWAALGKLTELIRQEEERGGEQRVGAVG